MWRGRGYGRCRCLWGWYLSRRCRWLAREWLHDRCDGRGNLWRWRSSWGSRFQIRGSLSRGRYFSPLQNRCGRRSGRLLRGHCRRRRNLDRRRKLNALRRDGHFSNRSRRSGCWALYPIHRSSRRSEARRRGLLLQLGDFASKMSGLPGLLLTRDLKVLAQSSVFPQQVKCEEGGKDQKDCE